MKPLLLLLAILIALVIALLWPNDQVCGGAFPPSA